MQENIFNRKFTNQIQVNGTKKQQKKFIKNYLKFFPIAEKIVNESLYKH